MPHLERGLPIRYFGSLSRIEKLHVHLRTAIRLTLIK